MFWETVGVYELPATVVERYAIPVDALGSRTWIVALVPVMLRMD